MISAERQQRTRREERVAAPANPQRKLPSSIRDFKEGIESFNVTQPTTFAGR
jgi:hypothetical protein